MLKNRIVVVTDCVDVAANEIRGAIFSELDRLGTSERIEVEPPIFAKEFSIINGSFLTRLIGDSYPSTTTTILGVLNPLQTDRKDRARIIGETKNGLKFVGENTGLFGWLIRDLGLKEIFESSREGINGADFISFGGKYVHAPIAAKVASGVSLHEIGTTFDPERITYCDLKEGTVVHVDNFGVPKIFSKLTNLVEGQLVEIFVNDEQKGIATYTHSMKNLPDGTLAIYLGSSLHRLTEIGIVRSLETAVKLNIKVGDIVTWKTK